MDESVDLVIIASVRKRKNLVLKVREPRGFSGKEDLAVGEFFQLDGHARPLIAVWDDTDRRKPGGSEFLYQGSSEPGFFDQNLVRPVFSRLRNGARFQVR